MTAGPLTQALLALADTGRRPRCAADPDLWTSDDPAERAEAASRCQGCPVLDACHEAAEAGREEHHVWAGVDRTRQKRKYPRTEPGGNPDEDLADTPRQAAHLVAANEAPQVRRAAAEVSDTDYGTALVPVTRKESSMNPRSSAMARDPEASEVRAALRRARKLPVENFAARHVVTGACVYARLASGSVAVLRKGDYLPPDVPLDEIDRLKLGGLIKDHRPGTEVL